MDENCIQPNAVDVRLDKMWRFVKNTRFIIDENGKTHRQIELMKPSMADGNYYILKPGESYQFITQHVITVGPEECGFVISRSTLNRNGIVLTSGLYDSGYKGVMAGCLHVNSSGECWIKPGTRIGQFITFKSEVYKQYNGSYGLNTPEDIAMYGPGQEKKRPSNKKATKTNESGE